MQWLRDSRHVPNSEDQFLVLFHGPSTTDLAESIIAAHPNHIHRGEISWGKFEDGFPNIFIQNVESIRGRNVVFLASFLQHDDMLAQLSLIYSLPRYLIHSLIIVLPYFPTGTMERVEEEGQIATAMTLARLFSTTPIATGGPARLIIYDIHALANRFYFGDSVIPLLVSAIPLLVTELHSPKFEKDKVTIAFPDDGACKRFGRMFKDFPVVICSKVREGNQRIVKIKEGQEHIQGSHVFIVDDLVKTGGTLIECKGAILKHGAKNVSAFVTHSIFPQESWRKFTEEKPDQFTYFYTTDSCPETISVIKDKKPFIILPLGPSIGENILKY